MVVQGQPSRFSDYNSTLGQQNPSIKTLEQTSPMWTGGAGGFVKSIMPGEASRSATNYMYGLSPMSPESIYGLNEMARLYGGYQPSPMMGALNSPAMTGGLETALSEYMNPEKSSTVQQPFQAYQQGAEADLNRKLAEIMGGSAKYGMTGSSGDAALKQGALRDYGTNLSQLFSNLILGARSGGLQGMSTFGNLAQIGEQGNLTPFALAQALRQGTAPAVQTGQTTESESKKTGAANFPFFGKMM